MGKVASETFFILHFAFFIDFLRFPATETNQVHLKPEFDSQPAPGVEP
jgi:hypothetical protein